MNDFVAVLPIVNVNVSVDCCLPMFSKGKREGGEMLGRQREKGELELCVCVRCSVYKCRRMQDQRECDKNVCNLFYIFQRTQII